MSAIADQRARARGKFLHAGGRKLFVRGVTYGTFAPSPDGAEFPAPELVERDFAQMASTGVNALRTYTVPPRWLLDAAWRHGLRVLVGLPMERYVGYLADGRGAPDLEGMVRDGVRSCAGHPAVLCYSIGNEIPASAVRWHGRRTIERFLERLYAAAKAEDPEAPVTYANYPSTEYLELGFLDVLCFNVFLESPPALKAYLARLQNLAGNRPLLLTEMGLDSRRNGEEAQAGSLGDQVRGAFAGGCAGAFVYAWTDEWHTASGEVHDWDFGLVRRDRSPKPALAAVRAAFAEIPFRRNGACPRASVIVCSRNGGRTIRACLEGIRRLEYPDFETIVVDDGSTDATADIAREYPVRLIRIPHGGLSHARNVGLAAATGDFVAYIDDDASPDPHWLTYLAHAFSGTPHAAVGGPNIAPPGNGFVGRCVANSPGNPVHVLLDDQEAEHIPGCNMAFRRSSLLAIGGFDPRFRAAGDDVDVCWRLRENGSSLGFSPAAMVWHLPRSSVRAFWKQQVGYGRAEALLEAKWPEKYNAAGHATWRGRVYGRALVPLLLRSARVYHGVWGAAPFQSLYEPAPTLFAALPLMPEWYLLLAALLVLSLLGTVWSPLLLAAPLLGIGVTASLVQAWRGAARARFDTPAGSLPERLRRGGLTALLHLLQPLARLRGRLGSGLTPWRRKGAAGLALPRPRRAAYWSEDWKPHDRWVRSIEEALLGDGETVLRGGGFDRFDLEVRGGMAGSVRILVGVEEHGGGRQLVRIRTWPRWSTWGLAMALPPSLLAAAAAADRSWTAAVVLGAFGAFLALGAAEECASAAAVVGRAVQQRVGAVATSLRALRKPS
ncbi:MAG TPA: glycosyltransferase [Planctomycetota bacterium]|jgi:GT2 family glycosyltransferase|nr:glycosyltransferase [Planctomycetota bacterium]